MTVIKRVDALNQDFSILAKELDLELLKQYTNIQHVYTPLNMTEDIKTAVIAYEFNIPIACGCFRINDSESVEIKRMFVKPDARGKGISKLILNELIAWAKELGYAKAVLETGIKQMEAIGLYKKYGFVISENYGPYKNITNSICFEKIF